MKITLGQIKPVTGDLKGNTEQILAGIAKAKSEKSDMVVFPETAITGYCCGSLFEQERFIKENKHYLLDVIVPASKGITVVVGFVDFKEVYKNGALHITNSVAVIQKGKLVGTYDKILLANDGHHEDKKYFTPGTTVKTFPLTIAGKKHVLGIPICEDAWNIHYERDIVHEMVLQGATMIVCPNYSYFYTGKQELRRKLFSAHAKEKQVPVIMVNAVGVGDIVKDIMIYDGGSSIFSAHGDLIFETDRFTSQLLTVDLSLATKIIPMTYDKYEELFKALVFEQQEFFKLCGLEHAQVHMSGGLDSSVVGALVAYAMGPKNTVFITNPTVHNSDLTKNNAYFSAKQLGVEIYTNETQGPYVAAMDAFAKAFGKQPTPAQQAPLEAVMRTAQGISASHFFKSGIVATPNHTEIVLGWTTFHDIGSIGVHCPIGDLTKLELYEFSDYINTFYGKEVIPKSLYDGTTKPAAELADANEDPIDYKVMSGICAELIRNRRDPKTIIALFKEKKLTKEYFLDDVYETDLAYFKEQVELAFWKSKLSVYKAAQSAPLVIVNGRSRGFSNRETIINKWVMK